jgi:hypothetical protein
MLCSYDSSGCKELSSISLKKISFCRASKAKILARNMATALQLLQSVLPHLRSRGEGNFPPSVPTWSCCATRKDRIPGYVIRQKSVRFEYGNKFLYLQKQFTHKKRTLRETAHWNTIKVIEIPFCACTNVTGKWLRSNKFTEYNINPNAKYHLLHHSNHTITDHTNIDRKLIMYGGQQRMSCHLSSIRFASDNACPVQNLCTNSSNECSGRSVGKAANY